MLYIILGIILAIIVLFIYCALKLASETDKRERK